MTSEEITKQIRLVNCGSLSEFEKEIQQNPLTACAEIRIIEVGNTEKMAIYAKRYDLDRVSKIRLLEKGNLPIIETYLEANVGKRFPYPAELALLKRRQSDIIRAFLLRTSLSDKAMNWAEKNLDKEVVAGMVMLNEDRKRAERRRN